MMCYQTRKDALTAGKIEVALVYREMLGIEDAEEYLFREKISRETVKRVLFTDQLRGGSEHAYQEKVWTPEKDICRRNNFLYKAFVEAALKIECQLGRSRARQMLMNENIPRIIIDRVLLDGPRETRAIRA